MNKHKPDKKIFIEKLSEIESTDTVEYSGVYAGSTFCADAVPAIKTLVDMVRSANDRNLSFHLVTPYISESHFNRIFKLAEALAGAGPGSEIIVNDLGLLDVVSKELPDLVPVAGRVFAAQKTDPQIPGLLAAAFDADELDAKRRIFSGISFNNRPLADFMRSKGVSRLELQNAGQGIEILDKNFFYSLHIPYAYVSSTRFCPPLESYLNTGRVPGLYRCRGQCEDRYYRLEDPSNGSEFLLRGNTVYTKNVIAPPPPEVDRIVFHRLPS